MARASVAMISSQLFDITKDVDLLPDNLQIIFLGHGKSLKATNLANLKQKSARSLKAAQSLGAKVEVAVATSPYVAKIAAQCYGIEENRYRTTGHPRNDEMLAPSARTRELWADFLPDQGDRVILYAPTWRQAGEPTRLFPFADGDVQALANHLEEQKTTLLLRAHPRDLRGGSPIEEDIHQLTSATSRIRACPTETISNINPFLSFVDILITDYSSIWQDFILLDRPILFVPYDYDSFSRNQGFIDDYFENLPGPIVNSMSALLEYLNDFSAGKDTHRSQRDVIKKKFHTHLDAHSVSRVAELLDEVLGIRKAARKHVTYSDRTFPRVLDDASIQTQ